AADANRRQWTLFFSLGNSPPNNNSTIITSACERLLREFHKCAQRDSRRKEQSSFLPISHSAGLRNREYRAVLASGYLAAGPVPLDPTLESDDRRLDAWGVGRAGFLGSPGFVAAQRYDRALGVGRSHDHSH